MSVKMLKVVHGLDNVAPHYYCSKKSNTLMANAIHLLGFRFDGTSCFRKGADLGPQAIREVSDGYEDYSPYLQRSLNERPFFDLGNLPHFPTDWQKTTDFFFDMVKDVDIVKDNVRLVTLGGEHSISYAPIKTYLESYPDLALLHMDAHADLRDGYQGHKFSHASIIRRVLDHFGPGHELIQYGIRSGTKDEFEFMHKKQSLALSRKEFLDRVKALPDDRPIYLTLDLDYFDPCFLPGTGTPEAGGEDFHSFSSLTKILAEKNFVGADITELAPKIDATDVSACFATKVVRELLLALRV